MKAKAVKTALVGILLGLSSAALQAAPMNYTLTFDGSSIGPSGVGSFIWEPTTSTMTHLNWSFGVGQSGGLTSSAALASYGPYLYERIFGPSSPVTGQLYLPGGYGNIFGNFPADDAGSSVTFCASLGNTGCGMSNGAYSSYRFIDPTGAEIARGAVTASFVPDQIPEPTTLALMGLGLAGIGFARKKKQI